MAVEPDIPKLEVPMSFLNGKARVVQQDSQQEIEQCVEAVVRTTEGEREDYPTFGIPDMVHGDVDVVAVRVAIEEHEPRADFLIGTDDETLADYVGTIQIEMKGTGEQDG